MDILFGEFGRGWILYIKNYLIYNMDNLIGGYGGIWIDTDRNSTYTGLERPAFSLF